MPNTGKYRKKCWLNAKYRKYRNKGACGRYDIIDDIMSHDDEHLQSHKFSSNIISQSDEALLCVYISSNKRLCSTKRQTSFHIQKSRD